MPGIVCVGVVDFAVDLGRYSLVEARVKRQGVHTAGLGSMRISHKINYPREYFIPEQSETGYGLLSRRRFDLDGYKLKIYFLIFLRKV